MTHKNDRVLSVKELARVEGEGALYLRASGNRVEEARLDIYEPPRFFEAFLRGRAHTEPPDITARICGICPVAYQMSACQALEDACGVAVGEPIADLRRLLYCGEWIESHALHIYLLHAPDFLGYRSGIEMAAQRRDVVERGLALKKAGNAIMEAVGGRPIHPVNVRLGGFYRAPARAELAALTDPLRRALDDALATVRWVAGFDFPDHACDADMLALWRPGTYPIERGTVRTRSDLTFPAAGWGDHVIEEQVPHSTALHAHLAGGGRYLTGPLARYSLSSAWLSPLAREAARDAGLGPTCDNPFRSIIVRAVETVYAVDEALRLIEAYEPPDPPAVEVQPRAGVGHGVTEAPRGTLYHRYEIGADGLITSARIVPPTSQNQAAIEADLRAFAEARLSLDDAELTRQCEQAIRNYDPCISCSAHFLDLTVERSLSRPNGRWFPVSGPGPGPVVVIGVGNEFRRDDGAGPAVVDQLRGLVPSGAELVITDGEPSRLIEAWTGAALAVVVDAVRVVGPQPPQPGRVHRFVVDRPGVGAARTASSHGFGFDDAIALAVALDRMPGRLIVHAIEAADLTQGTGLTPAVAEAVGVVAAAILDDIGAGRRLSARCRGQSRKTSVPGTSARGRRPPRGRGFGLRHPITTGAPPGCPDHLPPTSAEREMLKYPTDHAGLEILPFDRCLQLLATVPVGRVSFFADGEIVVLPVNHAMDGPNLVFRTARGSKLSAAEGHNLVAFEADEYDQRTRTGWSVLVNGRVEVIYEEAEIRRLAQLGLHPWVTAVDRPFWIRIRPSSISGRQTPAPG